MMLQDFFPRHYCGKCGTGPLILYLMKRGFKLVPRFEFSVEVEGREREKVKTIYEYWKIDKISICILADLDFDVRTGYDDKFGFAIGDFFKQRGYPRLEDVTYEDELVQFVNALKKDDFKTEDYFEITAE